ncbi:hypothetical protein [Tautonia rosea]|uniref:hypothetical protein n=1 Tax=Tautonia rosea TaxID=2728037 RepID=UPI001F32D289|nr:hypothetical protein [Tautonia rosea]
MNGRPSDSSPSVTALEPRPDTAPEADTEPATPADRSIDPGGSPELHRALAEVKGQAQFLLYLADQIEESLQQFAEEADASHSAFLCKVLSMYSGQLEVKYQSLGERIAETCQEVYLTVRERDAG